MLQTMGIAVGGIVGLMLVWILVQTLWRNTFAEHIQDSDVLAGRTKCSNCGCTSVCENRNIDPGEVIPQS